MILLIKIFASLGQVECAFGPCEVPGGGPGEICDDGFCPSRVCRGHRRPVRVNRFCRDSRAAVGAAKPNAVATATPAEATKPETAAPLGHQASDAELPPAAEDDSAAAAASRCLRPSRRCSPTSISHHQVMTVSDTSGEIGEAGRFHPRAAATRRRPAPTPRAGRRACTTRASTTGRRCRMRCSSRTASPCTRPTPSAISDSPASHGCVRLHPKNAKIFYNLVQKHGEPLTQDRGARQAAVFGRGRRWSQRRYQRYQPYGFFASQPYYDQRRVRRQRYGGGYNTW